MVTCILGKMSNYLGQYNESFSKIPRLKENKMIDDDILDILQDLDIDKDRLDFESIDQPKRFFKYAKAEAGAEKGRRNLKRKTSVKRAELSLSIRANSEHYGLGKVTDAAIMSVLEIQPEVEELENELNEAIYQSDIYGAAKNAFEERKTSIENLVKLYNQGYWSRPKMDIDSKEAMTSMSENATETQREILESKMALRTRKK